MIVVSIVEMIMFLYSVFMIELFGFILMNSVLMIEVMIEILFSISGYRIVLCLVLVIIRLFSSMVVIIVIV